MLTVAVSVPVGVAHVKLSGLSATVTRLVSFNTCLLYTSFQCPKLAFVQPQSAEYVGEWQVVDIGLSAAYAEATATPYFFSTASLINDFKISNRRKKYAHKGSFGHALLIGGSYGKIGAIVLSSKACLRSGVGLLTVQTPRCGYDILQTSLPEAMALPDWHWMVNTTVPNIAGYSLSLIHI